MRGRVFITATDTDAGKTWVTAGAVRSLLAAGLCVRAVKPVACGLDVAGRNEDVQLLLDAQGLPDVDDISLYRFALPAAPSLAAAAEGAKIVPDELVQWCGELFADHCLIEGVGGLMVPLTDHWLVCDWIDAMPECDVWLVVGCRLGAINHALLTLSVLKQIGREPVLVIFNAARPADEGWLQPVCQAVEPFLPAGCRLHSLRYGEVFDPLR